MRVSTSTNIYLRRPDGRFASIEESMEQCSKAGYRVMDLNFYDATTFHLEFMSPTWESWSYKVKDLAEKLGIEFSQGHSSFYNFCEPEKVKDFEYWETSVKRSVLSAEIIGIPWIVIHAGTSFDAGNDYKEVSFRKNMDYFKEFVTFASEHNVGLAFENLWDLNIRPQRRYTANAEELMEFVNAIKPYAPNHVGTCWDFEHADIMGQDQRKSLTLLGKTLKCTHCSDQTGINNDHIIPFSGSIDWKEAVHILRDIGYEGDFTYEMHRYGMNTPEPLVQDALKYSLKMGEYILSL